MVEGEVGGPTMESQNLLYLALFPVGHSSAAQELLKMKSGATGTAAAFLGSGKKRPQRKERLK